MSQSTYTEKVDFYWVTTIADASAPKVSEITAGQKLTCQIAEAPDMAEKTTTVDAPTLCDRFVSKYPDAVTVDDTSIAFYYDDAPSSTGETIRALLDRDATGFLVRIDSVSGSIPTIAAAVKVDVWPAIVSSNSKNKPAAGEMRKFTVGIAFTAPPSLDVAVVT